MAIYYFTSTADSGAGSLRQMLADYGSGNTYAPDASLYGDGDAVVIYLESSLSGVYYSNFTSGISGKKLIFDGSHMDEVSCRFATTLASTSTAAATFTDIVWRNFVYNPNTSTVRGCLLSWYNGSISLERCGIFNCYNDGPRGPILMLAGSSSHLTMTGCLVYGSGSTDGTRGAVNVMGGNCFATIDGCTMGHCVGDCDVYLVAASQLTKTNSLIRACNFSSLSDDFENTVVDYANNDFRLLDTSAWATSRTAAGVDYYGQAIAAGGPVGCLAEVVHWFDDVRMFYAAPSTAWAWRSNAATAWPWQAVSQTISVSDVYKFSVSDYSIISPRK